jgi:hypothetical protein
MTFLEHLLEFLLVVTLFGAAVLAVAFLVARSYVRRHWRVLRGHQITRALVSGLSFLSAGRERWLARATPEQLSQGTATRVRRRMLSAVEDAEIAVAHAASHDAPVAELPAVCRSLRSAAEELDGLLRHERRLPVGARPEAVRRQVADVIAAARDVQSAALGAGGDAAGTRIRSLVQQAGDEVEIVSAAVSRLRSLQSR